jgi:hypothetical protein
MKFIGYGKGLLRGLKGKQLSKSLKKTFLIATLEL